MRYPFETILKKKGFRQFVIPFSLALAVVFAALITAAS